MSGSDGFQVDLSELNTLANTDVPFVQNTCSNAMTAVQADGSQNDSAIFETWTSALYMDMATTFMETRADLENLLSTLSSSLGECAAALREIYNRYLEADMQNKIIINNVIPVTPIGHKI